MSEKTGDQQQQPPVKKRKRQKVHDPNHADVDCTNSEAKLWLVKVPKYLGQKWLDSNTPEVGKLSINRKGGRVEVTFKLNEHLAKSGDPSPIDHNLMLSAPSKSETLGVLSRAKDDSEREVRKVEGSIVQSAVCRPSGMNAAYNNLKRSSFRAAQRVDRKVVLLGKNEMPHSIRPRERHEERQQKTNTLEGRKNRIEPEKLKEWLFELFEKHQYYSLKDLGEITKQPMAFLKEMLREIAVYNSKASSKNMWELKPEYRYYDKT